MTLNGGTENPKLQRFCELKVRLYGSERIGRALLDKAHIWLEAQPMFCMSLYSYKKHWDSP